MCKNPEVIKAGRWSPMAQLLPCRPMQSLGQSIHVPSRGWRNGEERVQREHAKCLLRMILGQRHASSYIPYPIGLDVIMWPHQAAVQAGKYRPTKKSVIPKEEKNGSYRVIIRSCHIYHVPPGCPLRTYILPFCTLNIFKCPFTQHKAITIISHSPKDTLPPFSRETTQNQVQVPQQLQFQDLWGMFSSFKPVSTWCNPTEV